MGTEDDDTDLDLCPDALPDGHYISSMWTSDSVIDPSATSNTIRLADACRTGALCLIVFFRSAMFRVSSVTSARQAQQALQAVDLPGNWLLADTSNNIGNELIGIAALLLLT